MIAYYKFYTYVAGCARLVATKMTEAEALEHSRKFPHLVCEVVRVTT